MFSPLNILNTYHRQSGLGSTCFRISSQATRTMVSLRRNLALTPRHTNEVPYKTLVRRQLEYATPIWNLYHKIQIQQVERTAARWTCRRWRNTSSVGDMLDDLEWLSLEARKEQTFLTFFCKIQSGTVSLEKVPDPGTKIEKNKGIL